MLSKLIRKQGLATATPATFATHERQETGTVASVASVAVADQLLTEEETATVANVASVAVAVETEPLAELSSEQEASIRAWLAHIEETDQDTITKLLAKCGNDLDARLYCLQRAEEIPRTDSSSCPKCAGEGCRWCRGNLRD